MGSNKRFGTDITDAANTAFAARVRPISLTDEEIGTGTPPTEHDPIPVRAWVRFAETPADVVGHAIAWNDRAVLVQFSLPSGGTHRVWVWRSAVRLTQQPVPVKR